MKETGPNLDISDLPIENALLVSDQVGRVPGYLEELVEDHPGHK